MGAATNPFLKCLPAIGTNIGTCGSVSICDIATATADTLASIFTDASGDYRAMQSLLVADFEIKACGARTNGLYDFLMAQKKDWSRRVTKRSLDQLNTRFFVEPFIMADQQSVINNQYWQFDGGNDPSVAGVDWQIKAFSSTGIPLDSRWFYDRERIYANGISAGGSVTRTAYKVVTSVVVGARIVVNLVSENFSFTAASKVEAPVSGFLTRGTANVNDFEQWCNQIPGLNGTKSVPFWMETSRRTLCWDELYESYRSQLARDNAFFAKFGDLPYAKLNAQIAEDHQRRWLEAFFWQKRISAAQKLDGTPNYLSLAEITTAAPAAGSSYLYLPNEGRCVGRRANSIGVYEQLAECGRVFDLLGNTLNLEELFELIYAISRARSDQGGNGDVIDIFTDRSTRALIQLAMIQYYDAQAAGIARLNIEVGNTGTLGFVYDRYKLINPAGVTIHIITHNFFDDFKAQAVAAGKENAGNMLWILDFNTIYPAIIDSNRVVHNTGDLKALAAIDSAYACVMRNPTQQVTLDSLTWATVVSCPVQSAILENFASTTPAITRSVPYENYYTLL